MNSWQLTNFYLKPIFFPAIELVIIRRKIYLKFTYITLSQDSKVTYLQYLTKKKYISHAQLTFSEYSNKTDFVHFCFIHTNVSTMQHLWMLVTKKQTEWLWKYRTSVILPSTIQLCYIVKSRFIVCFISQIKIYWLIHCHQRTPAQNISSRPVMSTQHDWHTGNDKKWT